MMEAEGKQDIIEIDVSSFAKLFAKDRIDHLKATFNKDSTALDVEFQCENITWCVCNLTKSDFYTVEMPPSLFEMKRMKTEWAIFRPHWGGRRYKLEQTSPDRNAYEIFAIDKNDNRL